MSPRFFLIAGESSGDALGKDLIEIIKSRYPQAIIEGVAGDLMEKAGCKKFASLNEISFMGVIDVLKNLKQILKVKKSIINHCKINKPDIFIGIDAPDFNLRVSKKLKSFGVKTIQYVSPSVWAWRENRMKVIKKSCDLVWLLFPFEMSFYRKWKQKASFVGHSLAYKIPYNLKLKEYKFFKTDKLKIALLPGSRKMEINYLLPIFLKTIKKINQKYQTEVIIPSPSLDLLANYQKFDYQLKKLSIKIINNNDDQILKECDFAIVKSGTATLKTALYKKPMIVAYKASYLNIAIIYPFLKIKYFALPNIILGKKVVPEFIQNKCNPLKMANKVLELLADDHKKSKLIDNFNNLHHQLVTNKNEIILKDIAFLLKKY